MRYNKNMSTVIGPPTPNSYHPFDGRPYLSHVGENAYNIFLRHQNPDRFLAWCKVEADRIEQYATDRLRLPGVRVGDVVEVVIRETGETYFLRVSSVYNDRVQTSLHGSFYIDEGGGCSFSGGLYASVSVEDFEYAGETRASFWTFAEGCPGASRGVYGFGAVKKWKAVIGEDTMLARELSRYKQGTP